MEIISSLFLAAVILTTFIFLKALWIEADRKSKKNTIQDVDTAIQSKIDDMSPREFYTRKMSQTSLIWDHRTQAYLRKWSKNDTTFH